MTTGAQPADPLERFPCPMCAELVPVDARICRHCQTSTLVDVTLRAPIADVRTRHEIVRRLQALPDAPSAASSREGLVAARPAAARGVTRAFAHAALAVLGEYGIRAAIERPAVKESKSPAIWMGLWAAALVVLFAIGAMRFWRAAHKPGASATSVPQADAGKPGARPVAAAALPVLSPRELAQRALPSTVSVRCRQTIGSGFFVAPDLVLTNAHVLCPAGDTALVVLSNGHKLFGQTVRSDGAIDLGLLRVANANAEPLPLGDVADVAVGDKVMIIGSPIGLEFTVHEGNVSSVSRPLGGVAYVQLDAKVNPGNSGGPVIDDRGRVVGLVTLKAGGAEGIGLAVPINYAYSKDLALVSPPTPTSTTSAAFDKMVADARAANGGAIGRSSSSHEAVADPTMVDSDLLVAASVDQYNRLVLRILRVQGLSPRYEEITAHIWSTTEKICTMKGDVTTWKQVDPDQPGSGLPAAVLATFKSRGTMYVGESPLRWDLCDRDRMRGAVEIELAGAHPSASRLKLRNY